MKLYSDTLDYADISAAVRESSRSERVLMIERCNAICEPRVRTFGWNLVLYCHQSRRHFNTGCYGAGEEGAASWDDWGRVIALLFLKDPDARIGPYDRIGQFDRGRTRKFMVTAP